jgi:SOS-response transcriptional repressor LexA
MFATNGDKAAGWHGLLLSGIEVCRQVFSPLPPGWAARMKEQLDCADVFTYLSVADEIRRRLEEVREKREFKSWIQGTVGALQSTEEGKKLITAVRKLAMSGPESRHKGVILTTNYDNLIEALEEAGSRWKSVTWKDSQWASAASESRVVLHLHGAASNPDSIILSSADYQRLKTDLNDLLSQVHFVSRTLVFIGCGYGLNDPDIAPLKKKMMELIQKDATEHFILVRGDELRQFIESPLSDRISPVAYGRTFADLPEFLEKLAAGVEIDTSQDPEFYEPDAATAETREEAAAATAAPKWPAADGAEGSTDTAGDSTDTAEGSAAGTGATLQELAGPAQQQLQHALTQLRRAVGATEQVKDRRTVPAGVDDWTDLAVRDAVHQRVAASLTDPAADLECCSERVAHAVTEAEVGVRRLSAQEKFARYAALLTPLAGTVSELEKLSGELLGSIREASAVMGARADVWPYYRALSNTLAHANDLIKQANISAFVMKQALERLRTAAKSGGTAAEGMEARTEAWQAGAEGVRAAGRRPSQRRPDSGVATPERALAAADKVTEVPIVGRAAAGEATGAGEEHSGEEFFGTVPVLGDVDPRRVVAVLVEGDSMTRDNIHDGDYVIIDRELVPKDNDIAVIGIGGEGDSRAMVKRIRLESGGKVLGLKSSNPDRVDPDVPPEENPAPEGTVIGIYRRLK